MGQVGARPRYDVALPDLDDVWLAVHRATRSDTERVWGELCAAAGLVPTASFCSRRQLESLVAAMVAAGGVLRVSGTALRVRIQTFDTLHRIHPA